MNINELIKQQNNLIGTKNNKIIRNKKTIIFTVNLNKDCTERARQ